MRMETGESGLEKDRRKQLLPKELGPDRVAEHYLDLALTLGMCETHGFRSGNAAVGSAFWPTPRLTVG